MDWVAGLKDWRQFYRLMNGLRYGRYFAKRINDPVEAEKLARAPRPKRTKPEFPLDEYSTLMQQMLNIQDLLIVSIHAQGGGGSPKLSPRPTYLHEEIRSRLESESLKRNVFAKMLPHEFKDIE